MLIQYNTEDLEGIISDFHNLTGIAIAIIDAEFNMIVRCPKQINCFCASIQSNLQGYERCTKNDYTLLSKCKETLSAQTHQCHAGLTDIAVPIISDSVILGYIIMGQVCSNTFPVLPFDEIYPKIADLELDYSQIKNAYANLHFFDKNQIQSAATIVNILTKHIWLDRLIQQDKNLLITLITEFISSNLNSDLSVSALCSKFNVSKNLLYSQFQKNFHTTVNEYIINLRIKYAAELLQDTSLPVYQICEKVGIDNYQYFCRIFKKRIGIPPAQFRKTSSKHEKKIKVLIDTE